MIKRLGKHRQRLSFGLLVGLALTGLLSCQTDRAVERFHVSARVAAADYPDVPAVILLDRTEVVLSFSVERNRPYTEVTHLRRLQILSPQGLRYAEVDIPLDDGRALLGSQIRSIAPNGAIRDEIVDVTIGIPRFAPGTAGAKQYNNLRARRTRVPHVEVGDVVEIQTRQVLRDPRWLHPITLSGELPVVRGEVIIDHPTEFDVDFRVTEAGKVSTKVQPTRLPQRIAGPDDGVAGLRNAFVFKNLRAIHPEPRRPSVRALSTQVHVQLVAYRIGDERVVGFQTWDDVASWYRTLTAQQSAESKVATTAAEIGKQGTVDDKLARVQAFLQQNIGDVGEPVHVASLPMVSPDDVLSKEVGDAKAVARLGLALLKALGIPGFAVLAVGVGSFPSVPDLPTPASFDHVVIAVPRGGSFHFIDPVAGRLPTGRLSGRLQGQRGVVVGASSAELITFPTDAASDNQRLYRYDVAVGKDGAASGQLRLDLSGLDASLARTLLRHDDGLQLLRAQLDGPHAGGLVWKQAIPLTGGDGDDTLRLQIILGTGKIADKSGENLLLLDEQKATGRSGTSFEREFRSTPLVFPHRFESKVRTTIRLPDGWGVNALPDDTKQSLMGKPSSIGWSVSDGTLVQERSHVVDRRITSKAGYSAARNDWLELWREQSAIVELVPGGDRGTAYGDSPF